MKITVIGSLGYIGKPLTQELIRKGHSVTVISSKPERKKDIEAMGAKAAIGTMEDADFIAASFTGANAVYCMLALDGFTNPETDIKEQSKKVINNYVHAIRQSGVQRVVYLNSVGAHMDKGNGLLSIHHEAENILKQLPDEVSITFIRPGGFYKNLDHYTVLAKGKEFLGTFLALTNYGLVGMLKGKRGVILSNYGGNVVSTYASPLDIADAITEELESTVVGKKVRYVTSDELACSEAASILGAAIGKPYLKWESISSKRLLSEMKKNGLPPVVAEGLVEMNESIRTGKLFEDYNRNKPKMGKVKMKDYAREFATIYNKL